MANSPHDITGLLRSWHNGDQVAFDDLIQRVFRELHELAGACSRRENWNATLSATELVNEAYLRLAGRTMPEWENRAQFFAVSARLMHQIMVDRARARHALKRPQVASAAITQVPGLANTRIEFLDLHLALDDLAVDDIRKARLIELRYFVGLTAEEIAAVEGISERTVRREIRFAEAWIAERTRR